MKFFEHDGIRFRYHDTGSGIPFVFQHGLGADLNQTVELLASLPGLRLLAFECRGHGETWPLGPEDRISVEQFTDDLRAFLDHLGIEQAIVGGISMGAAIALRFVLEHPERALGLVLSRPAWLDESRADNLRVFATLAEYIRRYGAWEGAQRYQETEAFKKVFEKSPDNARSLLAQFAHPRAEETVARLERIPAYVPAHTRDDWKRVAVPTLVLANREDEIHPFEFGPALAEAIPNAAFREITPKSASAEQHAADVRNAIAEFLRRHFPTR